MKFGIMIVQKKHTFFLNMNETIETRYIVTVSTNTPSIMCEKHAQMFEKIMTVANIPHTIIELDTEEEMPKCHACNLQTDILDSTPRIILPH